MRATKRMFCAPVRSGAKLPAKPSGQEMLPWRRIEPVLGCTVPAILATIFCCLPFGIVGIVFAAQVNSKWAVGDVTGANDSAAKAKLWTLISVGVSVAGLVIWLLLLAMGVASMSFSST